MADINIEDVWGRTPLRMAHNSGKKKCGRVSFEPRMH